MVTKITEQQRLLVVPCIRREMIASEMRLALIKKFKPGHGAISQQRRLIEHHESKIAALKATLELLIDVSA